MGVLTGKTDEQEHIEWDELRARAAIEAPLRKRIAEFEAKIDSAIAQCDNVIFNCEQVPADNAQHLRSWRSLRDFLRQQ